MKPLAVVFRDMGAWGWASLALIGLCIALAPAAGPTAIDWTRHAEKDLAGHAITLHTRGLIGTGAPVQVRLETDFPGLLRLALDDGARVEVIPGQALRMRVPADARGEFEVEGSGETVVWRAGRDRPPRSVRK